MTRPRIGSSGRSSHSSRRVCTGQWPSAGAWGSTGYVRT
jgi:hypothetical protein